MNKITKETLKRIKEGDYSALINTIEFLLDSYEEDKYDLGYKSCMEDLFVRSYRLAEEIMKFSAKRSPQKPFNFDNLAKIIEDYYTKTLKQ